MLTGAMLGLMRQLGMDIIVLTEEINDTEFFSSRLTRTETMRLLKSMAKTANSIPVETRERLHEIDWEAWTTLAKLLATPAKHPLQIWVAIKELTPMAVQQLNGYKKVHPELFSIVP